MKRVVGVVLALAVVTAACGDTIAERPQLDDFNHTTLRAQAFADACREVLCAGAPILSPSSLPEGVRNKIVSSFTDEVLYVDDELLDQWVAPEGRFLDGATMLEPGRPYPIGDDFFGVDVTISRGVHDLVIRTYVYRWTCDGWARVSPDSVGVTVTTAIS